MKSANYNTIETPHTSFIQPTHNEKCRLEPQKRDFSKFFIFVPLSLLCIGFLSVHIGMYDESFLEESISSGVATNNNKNSSIRAQQKQGKEIATKPSLSVSESLLSSDNLVTGVNIGSWLALEDWFYVGDGGAIEVATPDDKIAAVCLPPLHVGPSTGPKWHSETDLFISLMEEYSVLHALRVFHAHRVSYIDSDEDLSILQSLGVKHIRLPISWCLTDHDPTTINEDDDDDESLMKRFTCIDPFFGRDVIWPAVPKNIIVNFLKACTQYDIKVTLDIHTYAGGTSIGTFSGVWPKWPRFWTHGDQQATDENQPDTYGHDLFRKFVKWIESLEDSDPDAFAGLRAISPMNEPAHLAGLFGMNDNAPIPDSVNFLPNLPNDISEKYLEKLSLGGRENSNRTIIRDGPHVRVLLWLNKAIEIFRESNLPGKGKELHVNIHESIFSPSVLPKSDKNGATKLIGSWWASSTAKDERLSWAVLDMHHYHAWDDYCSGTVDGQIGNYTCNDKKAREKTFLRCMAWAHSAFRNSIDGACGHFGSKLLSAEFSPSTYHDVRYACNDLSTLRLSLNGQLNAAKNANIELFYWSYKMPYGDAFRNAWSFKHLMYLMGKLSHPDVSPFGCSSTL